MAASKRRHLVVSCIYAWKGTINKILWSVPDGPDNQWLQCLRSSLTHDGGDNLWHRYITKIQTTLNKRMYIWGIHTQHIYGSNVWLWNSFTNQMNIGRINMQGNNLCIYSSTDASSLLFREQVPKFRSTHLAFSKTKRKITNILKIQIWLK